jgi:hypothetical protein
MSEVTANVRGASPALKSALIADAEKEGISVSDAALRVLARRYGIKLPEGKGRKTTNAKATSGQLNVRMPVGLAALLYQASRVTGLTTSSVILAALSEHYEIPYELTPRAGGKVAV